MENQMCRMVVAAGGPATSPSDPFNEDDGLLAVTTSEQACLDAWYSVSDLSAPV